MLFNIKEFFTHNYWLLKNKFPEFWGYVGICIIVITYFSWNIVKLLIDGETFGSAAWNVVLELAFEIIALAICIGLYFAVRSVFGRVISKLTDFAYPLRSRHTKDQSQGPRREV